MSVQVFIALGANLAQPTKQIRRAIALVCLLPDTRLVKTSSFYATAPQGYENQPDFINAVIEISTGLSAQELLESLLAIESALGRERKFTNGPRTIDLDLLLYGTDTINKNELLVPHPRMQERAFVLVPLAEIASDICIPGHGPVRALLPAVADQPIQKLHL